MRKRTAPRTAQLAADALKREFERQMREHNWTHFNFDTAIAALSDEGFRIVKEHRTPGSAS